MTSFSSATTNGYFCSAAVFLHLHIILYFVLQNIPCIRFWKKIFISAANLLLIQGMRNEKDWKQEKCAEQFMYRTDLSSRRHNLLVNIYLCHGLEKNVCIASFILSVMNIIQHIVGVYFVDTYALIVFFVCFFFSRKSQNQLIKPLDNGKTWLQWIKVETYKNYYYSIVLELLIYWLLISKRSVTNISCIFRMKKKKTVNRIIRSCKRGHLGKGRDKFRLPLDYEGILVRDRNLK